MPHEQAEAGTAFSVSALLQVHWRAGLAPQEQRASEAQTQVPESFMQQVEATIVDLVCVVCKIGLWGLSK